MRNINSIKVGGINYEVIIKDLDELGKTDFTKSEIYLDSKLNDDQRVAALIHEVLHCVNSQMSEEKVEFLAQAIYQILKDNDLC